MNNLNMSKNEDPGKSGEICTLLNSIFYFISTAIIINNNGDYRLIARHNGKIIMDKPYRTIRGAKIAFSKFFHHRCWKENLRAEWSAFYKPEEHWLAESRQE